MPQYFVDMVNAFKFILLLLPNLQNVFYNLLIKPTKIIIKERKNHK